VNLTYNYTYCSYVNYPEGRHYCVSKVTKFVRACLDNTLYVVACFVFSKLYLCMFVSPSVPSLSATGLRLVVYRIRRLDVAPSNTLSRCGNCNHDLCWRPSTSLIYICLSCCTGSCSARTIPSHTIATYAGSPRYMGSLTAYVSCTNEYIVGVAKEKSERREFSMPSVHSINL